MVIEGGCHSTCITAYHVIEFPLTSGRRRPCRDGGGGEIAPGFAMLIEQNALHTLIHQRHLTPSCGGHAPTAERTLDPARIIGRELDPRPGSREQPRSKAGACAADPDKTISAIDQQAVSRAPGGLQMQRIGWVALDLAA
jgi:hypothetical protein